MPERGISHLVTIDNCAALLPLSVYFTHYIIYFRRFFCAIPSLLTCLPRSQVYKSYLSATQSALLILRTTLSYTYIQSAEYKVQLQIDRIEAEIGQYRVLDEVGSESIYRDHRGNDLASTHEYVDGKPVIRDMSRMESVERDVAHISKKLDTLIDAWRVGVPAQQAQEPPAPTPFCPVDFSQPADEFVHHQL